MLCGNEFWGNDFEFDLTGAFSKLTDATQATIFKYDLVCKERHAETLIPRWPFLDKLSQKLLLHHKASPDLSDCQPKSKVVDATIWVASIIMQTLHRQCLNFPQTFRLRQLQCTINVKQPFENTRPRWIVGRVKSSRVSFSRLTLRTQKKDKISWIQKVSNKGFCCLSYFFS